MKLIPVIFALSTSLVLFAQTTVKEVTESARAIKTELRQSLVNEKYDGSKITYFEVRNTPVLKEFEIALFLRESYTMYFSGEAVKTNVSIRIFDKPYTSSDRTLLYDSKDISGKKVTLTTADLNDAYKKAKGSSAKLKSVYVEYGIPKGTPDLGAIVLIFGY
jgi:hypothetical protein